MQISKFAILIAALLMVACGYHLRGASDLPKGMNNIFLVGGSPIFKEQLENALKSTSGKLVETQDKADFVLRIFSDGIDRRTLSLSERGRSNDLELAGHLEFDVLSPSNAVLAPRETINFRREYFNDQQDVIAKDNEETVIRKEMYQQVVNQVINRSRMALGKVK